MGILWKLTVPGRSEANESGPEDHAVRVTVEKARAVAMMKALLESEGADEWSDVEGNCAIFAAKIYEVLDGPDAEFRIVEVHNIKGIGTHFHLRTRHGVIVDSTWQQWLHRKGLPEGLPRVFIGTRDDFIQLVTPLQNHLPFVDLRHREYPRRMTPQEFIDVHYGIGTNEDAASDATSEYAGFHKKQGKFAHRYKST